MFENEHTVRRFMTEKAEGQFHDRYERALEQVRSEFGRKYSMIIGGKKVRTPSTVVQTSPIDTRIVLGHLPVAPATSGRRWQTPKKRLRAGAGQAIRSA
jgi:1-pyrroline-5-carboxylate dehydrogenase